jgi:hypothetical protein
MKDAKSVRCLTGLRDASSARVLNLVTVEKTHGALPEYRKAPLFQSQVLNSSILLKHRLRSDEYFLFEDPQPNVTKIVIPFDKNDLRLGGTSLLCGQRGWLDTIREAGKYGDKSFTRDMQVLDILNELPSLDPFLIHERLLSSDIEVSDCYFELSKADKLRMHEFVANEIKQLIHLAMRNEKSSKRNDSGSTARLVTALLSTEADEQLEPLRATLMMGTDDFRKGIFSWRGFLYYKWSASELLPSISSVARDIIALPIARGARGDELRYITLSKRRLIKKMSENVKESRDVLAIYDSFFADLVERGQPQVFRDFLLRAPHMFVELGEKLGGLAHVVSFWNYRFPKRRLAPVDPETVISLFADFLSSVGLAAEEFESAGH